METNTQTGVETKKSINPYFRAAAAFSITTVVIGSTLLLKSGTPYGMEVGIGMGFVFLGLIFVAIVFFPIAVVFALSVIRILHQQQNKGRAEIIALAFAYFTFIELFLAVYVYFFA